MPKPSKLHDRRSHRLQGYDYSSGGAYFITVCIEHRTCLLGEVVNGEVLLNDAGAMVRDEWQAIITRFAGVELDQFIVMPNHIHGIIGITADQAELRVLPPPASVPTRAGEHKVRPYGTSEGSLGRIVQAYKSISTNRYIQGVKRSGWPRFDGHLWQRDYYDHIIRSNHALAAIREYIFSNPCRWADDMYNPAGNGSDDVDRFVCALQDE